jgi:hypothetical protein
LSKIEASLRKAMIRAADTSARECKYGMPRLRKMIENHGAIETARRILLEPTVSDGFGNLWEKHRLELSVEAIVLQPEFVQLFTAEEQAIARDRLEKADFSSRSRQTVPVVSDTR